MNYCYSYIRKLDRVEFSFLLTCYRINNSLSSKMSRLDSSSACPSRVRSDTVSWSHCQPPSQPPPTNTRMRAVPASSQTFSPRSKCQCRRLTPFWFIVSIFLHLLGTNQQVSLHVLAVTERHSFCLVYIIWLLTEMYVDISFESKAISFS